MTALLVVLAVAAAPAAKPNPSAADSARSIVVLSDLAMGPAAAQARDLTDALNQEVRRSLQFTWRDPPAISLDELILALNCTNMDEPCLKKAADSLKTDAIVFVASRSGAAGPEVFLTLVQVRPARPAKSQAVPLKDPPATQAAVRGAARSLLGPVKPTRLAITSTPAGADVLLDGKPVGQTPLALNDIPEGAHALLLRSQGHQDRKVDVTLGAGESQELNVALVATAAPTASVATGTATAAAAGSTEPAGAGNPLKMPLMAAGGAVVALGALVMLSAVLLVVSGVGSWAAYWSIIFINPGLQLGSSKVGGTGSTDPCVGDRCFATQPNAMIFGAASYLLFFPGLAAAFLAAMVLSAGAVVAAVPALMGGE